MSGLVRAFVAILLNEEVRKCVAEEIADLRPMARSVSWVAPENLHLTLKFLGERTSEEVHLAAQALAEATSGAAPFTLSFHGLGAFPGLARPRVFWVGVAAGAEDARMLQSRVEAALAQRTFAREERQFSPHLTIGRARMPSSLSGLREAITRGAGKEFGDLRVISISLMRSDLSSACARYSELKAFQLG